MVGSNWLDLELMFTFALSKINNKQKNCINLLNFNDLGLDLIGMELKIEAPGI